VGGAVDHEQVEHQHRDDERYEGRPRPDGKVHTGMRILRSHRGETDG
jgi:hypothetical protein